LLHFLVHEYTFQSIFRPKKISEEVCSKIYIGKDPDPEPDPDVFKSRIRIWSKIVQIRNTGCLNCFYFFIIIFCYLLITTKKMDHNTVKMVLDSSVIWLMKFRIRLTLDLYSIASREAYLSHLVPFSDKCHLTLKWINMLQVKQYK
jgi:hypothetical protein